MMRDVAATSPSDELVAVYDATGAVTGVAPRGEVYARSLWHGSAGVLLRSGDGRSVYVHRRATDKLVMPGLYDCWAGGVIGPGESPAQTAARELGEELGVTGVGLDPLFHTVWVEDGGGLRCHLFAYEARWDGPVRHQPEEIEDGGWMATAELRHRLADPGWAFAPDGRLLAERWFAERWSAEQQHPAV